ncbi:hypothetical protein [Methylobacter sp. YRD-M1]|uniref:hypothetical protein n=1 Tax=Methylobacter sp. YRD-M1 TaxID=2911520 RepID=UPI00227A2A0A|nr:hypothetical protein [Methylobacter sp. YRD-M1]WAK00664.1 hypothetical protein LZ558_12480 [Methylobacter sp. YRD-M1]
MPPAARISDMHTCPMVTGTVPHVDGPIAAGCPTVMIKDMTAHGGVIVAGCPTAIIGG